MEPITDQSYFSVQRQVGHPVTLHSVVYRATAGEFDELRLGVTREIDRAYDVTKYAVQRITGGTLTSSVAKVARNLYQTHFFTHSLGMVMREVGAFDSRTSNITRVVGYQDDTYNKVFRQRSHKDDGWPKVCRRVGQEDSLNAHTSLNVSNVDPGFSIIYRAVCKEEESASTTVHTMFSKERSVWTVERQLYSPPQKNVHTTVRQVARKFDLYSSARTNTVKTIKNYEASIRNLQGLTTEHFTVNRNIVVAHERSFHVVIRREIIVEQERYNTVRHISTGWAREHFPVVLTPIDKVEHLNHVVRRVMQTEESDWLTIRKMGKAPEEYFGKACLFRSNVSNLVLSKEMIDANIALDHVYSDKEALLEIAMQRDDVHDAVNLHGNVVEFHDGKLVYYPPLNSQSTVMVVPNWNTSEEMTKECREKKMIVEAYKVDGKHYKLHVRFDEPPKCPLYFSIVALNPDRTVVDDGFPTVINLITAEGLSQEQIKQIGNVINLPVETNVHG